MRLRLTVDVEYDANSVPQHLLQEYMNNVVVDAMDKNAFTGVSGATVNNFRTKIDRLDNPTPQPTFRVVVTTKRRHWREIEAPDAITARNKIQSLLETKGTEVTETWNEDLRGLSFETEAKE